HQPEEVRHPGRLPPDSLRRLRGRRRLLDWAELRAEQWAHLPRGEMSARAALALCLLVAGCKEDRGRSTDTRSANIQSKELKLAFLKDYVGGPTPPLDAEFHLVFHDNSGGLLAGPSDYEYQLVIRVKPDDVFKWA